MMSGAVRSRDPRDIQRVYSNYRCRRCRCRRCANGERRRTNDIPKGTARAPDRCRRALCSA